MFFLSVFRKLIMSKEINVKSQTPNLKPILKNDNKSEKKEDESVSLQNLKIHFQLKNYYSKKILLFYCKQQERLAKYIQNRNKESIILGSIQWKVCTYYYKITSI